MINHIINTIIRDKFIVIEHHDIMLLFCPTRYVVPRSYYNFNKNLKFIENDIIIWSHNMQLTVYFTTRVINYVKNNGGDADVISFTNDGQLYMYQSRSSEITILCPPSGSS